LRSNRIRNPGLLDLARVMSVKVLNVSDNTITPEGIASYLLLQRRNANMEHRLHRSREAHIVALDVAWEARGVNVHDAFTMGRSTTTSEQLPALIEASHKAAVNAVATHTPPTHIIKERESWPALLPSAADRGDGRGETVRSLWVSMRALIFQSLVALQCIEYRMSVPMNILGIEKKLRIK
jgi:hypothetical protein